MPGEDSSFIEGSADGTGVARQKPYRVFPCTTMSRGHGAPSTHESCAHGLCVRIAICNKVDSQVFDWYSQNVQETVIGFHSATKFAKLGLRLAVTSKVLGHNEFCFGIFHLISKINLANYISTKTSLSLDY